MIFFSRRAVNSGDRRISGATFAGSAFALMTCAATSVAQSQPREDSAWEVSLGAGALYNPDYDGSDEYEVDPLPLIAINYRDFIMLRGPALMVDVFQLSGSKLAENLSFGALVKYDLGREANDNPILRHLPDIDGGAEAGLFAEYELGPVTFELSAVQDTGSRHEGAVAEFAIAYGHMLASRLRGQVEASVAWADDDYTQSYFGVAAAQAQASGLREFAAEGGLKDAGVSASLHYLLNEHWRITGRLAYRRLLGDAADGPLVEDYGSQNQASGAVVVSYSF
jgi:outer membrane scaffolding protein for murein synthesis (MipA/OmpV family)